MRGKKCIYVAFICIICVIFSSCNTIEVSNRAFVEVLGIDMLNGEYLVTMRLLKAVSGGDTQKSEGVFAQGTGKTLGDAISNADDLLDKRIFCGHCKLVVIGESAENSSKTSTKLQPILPQISESLKYFVEGNKMSISTDLAFAEDASAVIKKMDGENFKVDMLKKFSEKGKIIRGDFSDYLGNSVGYGKTTVLPKIALNGEIPVLDGVYVAKNDDIVGKASGDYVFGMGILMGKNSSYNGEILTQNGNSGVKIEKIDVKMLPKIHSGKVEVDVAINAETRLIEGENSDNLEYFIEQLLLEKCEKAVMVSKACKADIFGIEKLLKRYEPKYLEQNAQNFDDIISSCKFEFNINCKLI
ncbi:MAG: Ger(x)C family spore germination C-terminal domain-containing protein [Oscillospiraceae bacterium]